ncbi:MAG: hypothetical protein HYU87_07170 [Chloroflexi bacterium]|nr:hypothetical protein [Chloroflexota bacterium]
MQEGATLRPLGVGDIVDRVFGIYRQRPLMFITIAAIPYLLLVLVVAVITASFAAGAIVALAPLLTGDVTPETLQAERFLPVLGTLVAFLVIVMVVAIAVSLVQSASLIAAMAARYMGRETTVGAALGAGFARSFDLFVMGILATLAFIGMWIALIAGMAVAQQWWIVILGVCGGLVATVFLTASWMVSPAIVILEQAGPVAALRRAWALSTGNRWRILGLILLLSVLQVVLSSLLSFVLLASFATDQVVQLILQQAVNLIATIAWAPVYWGTFAVLYYDLRVRREAFDLQLAAEALPRAP